jgi:hypothetical protein
MQVMRNRVNPMHEPHRRPVGDSRIVVPPQAAGRWARPTVARYACGAERGVLGLTHRCSLARSASSLSALSDLSSPLPTVAALRAAHAFAVETGRRPTRPREAGSERSLHRRQLQLGEKRALLSTLQNAAKAAKSRQSQTAIVLLSPCTWPALRLMKQSSSNP